MPGFITHYIYGKEVRSYLPHSPWKKNLYQNRGPFGVGLQGPDVFFYYLPSYLGHSENPGALAHVAATRDFYTGLLEASEQFSSPADRRIAEAYLAGFLGHYTLDTVCHPYIYAMSHYTGKKKDYFSHHAYLEMDIDTILLDEKLGCKPCMFRHEDTVRLTTRERHVIAQMLCHAYRRAFPSRHFRSSTMYLGLFFMPVTLRFLHDDSGQKKAGIRLLERHILGYPLFSPLILSDTLYFRTDPLNLRHAVWHNPWDTSLCSNENFYDLYEKAQRIYLRRLINLDELLHCQDCSKRRQLTHAFLEDYGDLSFHSGLDVSIPS